MKKTSNCRRFSCCIDSEDDYDTPANFFGVKGKRFLSCRVPEFLKMIRLLSKISGNFRGRSEESRSFTMRLKSTEKEQSPRLIGEPGLSVIYIDCSFHKLDQVYIFLCQMGHLKRLDHICESGVRNWSASVIWREIKVLDPQA